MTIRRSIYPVLSIVLFSMLPFFFTLDVEAQDDDGPQVTAAIPCDYGPGSMTTAFDRCLDDEPVPLPSSPPPSSTVYFSDVRVPHDPLIIDQNSCFVNAPKLKNTQGNQVSPFPNIVQIAEVFVENRSTVLDCEFTISFFHSENVNTVGWSGQDSNICQFLSDQTGRCSTVLKDGEDMTLYFTVAINSGHVYPSVAQLTAPGLPWVHTWNFYGYGNFQPFVFGE